MKYQVLFSLKNNEKGFMNVVCRSRDGALRVNINALTKIRLKCGMPSIALPTDMMRERERNRDK